MTKDIFILNGLILFYIIQRISEVFMSKTNEEWLKNNHQAIEVDKNESLQMKVFHTFWFLSLTIEANFYHSFQSPLYSLIIYSILAICFIVRFHTMKVLREFWTIKVLSLGAPQIATTGLYKYIRHPNYLIVIIELLFIPLLFKAYWTMTIFSLANIFVLLRRIKLEEKSLFQHTEYRNHFGNKKRFLPYIILICLTTFSLNANEINLQLSTYNEAKNHPEFLTFKSTSTKLGLFTTEFDGYVKKIKINYLINKNNITNLEVILNVKSFDTDNKLRDEKMLTEILDASTYPTLTASFEEPIHLSVGEQTINAKLTIKEKTLIRPVQIQFSQDGSKWIIKGKTQIGLKELGLPDPSIAIAKVRDLFEIEFSFSLESK